MSIIEAVLQGILQGLTEFLPVSSSGHLSLFHHPEAHRPAPFRVGRGRGR